MTLQIGGDALVPLQGPHIAMYIGMALHQMPGDVWWRTWRPDIPTFGGGMFEGLMAKPVVPETTWGPRSFGLADQRTAQVQIHVGDRTGLSGMGNVAVQYSR